MTRNNLLELGIMYSDLCMKRMACNFTGRADLDALNKMRSIRRSVSSELETVRAQLEVCRPDMISELYERKEQLINWLRTHS